MKHLLIAVLTISFLFDTTCTSAQDCSTVIVEDKFDNDIHILQTALQTIVDRGKSNYSIKFLNNENGILAKVSTKGDLAFYPNDEIFFQNASNDRKGYKFSDLGKLKNQNFFVLDLADVKWISNVTINAVFFKSNKTNTLYKFELDSNQQSGLINLATCFSVKLD